MRALNQKLTRIARVVVHPKYRTVGAGVKLVHDSLPLCGKPCVEMIAVMARYNPFAEHAGMHRICETTPDKTVTDAVAALEKLGFTPYMLSVPQYNRRVLKGRTAGVKGILRDFRFPYNRRVAGQHGNFTMKDWREWLATASPGDLAKALARLAQLDQTKVYLFWKKERDV
ncbi:MAG: hypothetical protein U9O89_07450 [Thermoproteota archaeon]|nr:hypothetical protein [Thermoproteota archaeon]